MNFAESSVAVAGIDREAFNRTTSGSLEKIDLQAHEKLVDLLLEQFPADKYHPVVLGRSPTLMAARLEALGMPFSHLPLSFRYFTPKGIEQSAHEQALLTLDLLKHFARYLPSRAQLEGKEPVLIDFVYSGRSLFSSLSMIEMYYGDLKVHFFCFGDNEELALRHKKGTGIFVSLNRVDPSSVVSKSFVREKYKGYAFLPSFRFSKMSTFHYEEHEMLDPEAISANEKYRHLVALWRARLPSKL